MKKVNKREKGVKENKRKERGEKVRGGVNK
jgi:hypothetical protein